MISFAEALPNIVIVNGKAYAIYTDFRVWMRFCLEFEAFRDGGYEGVMDISYLFKNLLPEFEKPEDYQTIIDFAYPQNVVPRGIQDAEERILDFRIDSDYIYSAFMQDYKIDLCEAKMHWHKFKALLNGISENTRLCQIMGYRSYTGEQVENHDKIYKKLKNAWELPKKLTEEEKHQNEEFERYFS